VSSLRDTIPSLLAAHRVPGLAIGVVEEGRVVWSGGFGLRESNGGRPVTNETVFEAASLSKPVFSYLIMRLVDQGVIALDTAVARYLPDFRPADPRIGRVTARQILSHAAGFPPWERDPDLRLDADPGSRWTYSGEGYVFLQHVLEAITGEALPNLARRLVFEPLGMSRSSFGWRESPGTNAATPHDSSGVPQEPSLFGEEDVARFGAASTLYTTASDFARFLSRTIGPNSGPHVSEVFEPHIAVDENLGLSWGLGWAIQHSEDNRPWVFHWGANPHFRSFVMIQPATGHGWVAFANAPEGLELMDEIAALLTGADHPLFSFYMMHPTD
jgi:CubicO group peptidase (beta-lactamase class C family)